jgi:hypothetical protein
MCIFCGNRCYGLGDFIIVGIPLLLAFTLKSIRLKNHKYATSKIHRTNAGPPNAKKTPKNDN